MKYYLKCLKHYADFHGRARRSEYWYFALFNVLISIIITVVLTWIEVLAGGSGLIALGVSYAYNLAVAIPTLAVSVRRLHDVGKSGWFYLIYFIPIVGVIWLFVLFCTEGQKETNQWGDNPKTI